MNLNEDVIINLILKQEFFFHKKKIKSIEKIKIYDKLLICFFWIKIKKINIFCS